MSIDLPDFPSGSGQSYASEEAKEEVRVALRGRLGDLATFHFELPPREIDADLALPCFGLSKTLRKSPSAIAEELASSLTWPEDGLIERAEADSGYLNLFYHPERFARKVLVEVGQRGDRYGASERGSGQSVLIDFSSPNIAKPMSVGHLRSTLIGDSLSRLYSFQGYQTVGTNHLGDWGTQFGKLIVAYQKWGDEEALLRDPIQELLRLYVHFHSRSEKEKTLEEEAREAFRLLEEGDLRIRGLWGRFRTLSLREFEKIYRTLGVTFDEWSGESAYNEQTGSMIDEAVKKGVAVESEGALIIPLTQEGIATPMVLRKRDGTSLYATRDLAAARFRIERYHPVLMIYVVGAEQKLHFQQLFAALRKLGYSSVRCEHVDFGLMSLPEGRMSTRKGRVVFLEEVIEEAILRAKAILEAKNPELSPSEREEVARMVGVGALKYNDLSQNRIKEVTFDWEKMLSFEGDSAPYLQYTHVRAVSILRKAGLGPGSTRSVAKGELLFRRPEEIRLAKTLARFPEVVRSAADLFFPHLVANFLFRLAQEFHAFYQQVPVLRAEGEEERFTRLAMVQGVAAITRRGLFLLGIEAPERM
jgi:arginyl-tRNA synthetase